MKKMQLTILKLGRAVMLAAAIVLVTMGSGYAADSLAVPSITPLLENVPDAHKAGPPGAAYYIEGERRGFLERIGEDGKKLVISDATKRLAADARFYSKAHGIPISLSEFQVGTYIGYTVNAQAEIDMMWIAEKSMVVPQLP